MPRKKLSKRIVVGLADRIEFVIVATRTAESQPEKCGSGRDHDIVEVVVLGHERAVRLIIPNMEAIESGGHDRVAPFLAGTRTTGGGMLGDFIARQLLADELVVRFIVVERINDVISIAPGVRLLAIALVAIAFGIAHQIQPVSSPALAIMGRSEQSIDQSFPLCIGWLPLKVGHGFGTRRQSPQVEIGAPHLLARRRRPTHRQPFFLELREQQCIDRMTRWCPCIFGRNGRRTLPAETPNNFGRHRSA